MVTSSTNDIRPAGLGLPGEYVPTYGVGRTFFSETVPSQVPPNWNFMGQPDGSLVAVGSPFVGYRNPSAFGRRGIRRFGAGGCGSPLMERDASGKCVTKSLKGLYKAAKKKGGQALKGAGNMLDQLAKY
jgi:hypothetical protein